MSEVKPSIFVELGTHWGDSYFTFCQSREVNDLKTKCYAVDHWQGDEHSGFYDNLVYKSVNEYNESNYSSFSYLKRKTFDQALLDFTDGSIDLLHIDGHHSFQSILHDFTSWLPKVKSNGLILIHDTTVKKKDFGVWKFWRDISKEYPSYNLSFSFGLGVIRKVFNSESEIVVSHSFDHKLKSNYYQSIYLRIKHNESRK